MGGPLLLRLIYAFLTLALVLTAFHAVLIVLGQGVYSFYLFLHVTLWIVSAIALLTFGRLSYLTVNRSKQHSALSWWSTVRIVRYEILLSLLSYLFVSLVTFHEGHQIYWTL